MAKAKGKTMIVRNNYVACVEKDSVEGTIVMPGSVKPSTVGKDLVVLVAGKDAPDLEPGDVIKVDEPQGGFHTVQDELHGTIFLIEQHRIIVAWKTA